MIAISPKAMIEEKSRIILVAILLFFFAIGITGIFYSRSLPYAVHDEAPNMITTLKMIADGSFRPAYSASYYFPLAVYIYLPFFVALLVFLRLSGLVTSLAALKVLGIVDYAEFLPLVRFISVLFGAASVFLVYKITEKLFNNRSTGLIASFLLSTSLLFVQLSHFGRIWVLQTFFILFAFYFIVTKLYLKDRPSGKDYFWAAVSMGISFGVNCVGLLVYLPFLVVHFLKNQGAGFIRIFIKNKYLWLANSVILLFVPLIYSLNPYGFNNYKYWFSKAVAFAFQSSAYKINFFEGITLYDKILFEYEPILFFLAIPCAILLFYKKRRIFYVLSSFIIGYYLFIKSIPATLSGMIHAPRYLLPLIPFLVILASYGLSWFLENTRFIRKEIRIALLIIVFAFALYLPLRWDYVLIQPNNRLLAQDWIYKNIPPDARILNFDAYLFLNENRQAMEDTRKYNQEFFLKKQNYLLSLEDSEFPKPNHYVLIVQHYVKYYKEIPKEIRDKAFDYAVIGWWNKEDYLSYKDLAKQFGISGVEEKNLIKRFPESATMETSVSDIVNNMRKPFHYLRIMKNTGPVMDIYKL